MPFYHQPHQHPRAQTRPPQPPRRLCLRLRRQTISLHYKLGSVQSLKAIWLSSILRQFIG